MRRYGPRQTKRPKPTMETAHAFHQAGVYPFDGRTAYATAQERIDEGEKIADELMELVKTQFPSRTNNLEYAILKAHLIVEHAIVQYIRAYSRVHMTEKQIGFMFSQRLKIAYMLGFGVSDPTLIPTVERLNEVRNQVAHTFVLDRRAVDEMLQINHEDYKNFKPKNDRERIRVLRFICAFICGKTCGMIDASLLDEFREVYGDKESAK